MNGDNMKKDETYFDDYKGRSQEDIIKDKEILQGILSFIIFFLILGLTLIYLFEMLL